MASCLALAWAGQGRAEDKAGQQDLQDYKVKGEKKGFFQPVKR